jgi:hypothetical protein
LQYVYRFRSRLAAPKKPSKVSKRLTSILEQLVELQKEQNSKLDKITALLVGQQLLTECVDYQNQPRTPEECAEITIESFSAALCLMGELDQRNREYQYQKQEFFINDEEDDDEEEINEISDSF